MTLKTGQVWSGLIVTRDSTGALSAASVGPAGTLYVDGTATGTAVTISGANPYRWTCTLPALTAGQCVSMYITATVATIATAAVVAQNTADTVLASDLSTAIATVDGVADGIATALATVDGIVDDILTDTGTTLPAAIAAIDLDDVWTSPTRTLTSSVAETIDTMTGSNIEITAGATYSHTWSGLTIPATWTAIYWTVQTSDANADTSAIAQVRVSNPAAGTDGLLRLNGAAGTAAHGSLVVDQPNGTVTLTLADNASINLSPWKGIPYDVKVLHGSGLSTILRSGDCTIVNTPTKAI